MTSKSVSVTVPAFQFLVKCYVTKSLREEKP